MFGRHSPECLCPVCHRGNSTGHVVGRQVIEVLEIKFDIGRRKVPRSLYQGVSEVFVKHPMPLLQQHPQTVGFALLHHRILDRAKAVKSNLLSSLQDGITGDRFDCGSIVDHPVHGRNRDTGGACQIAYGWS